VARLLPPIGTRRRGGERRDTGEVLLLRRLAPGDTGGERIANTREAGRRHCSGRGSPGGGPRRHDRRCPRLRSRPGEGSGGEREPIRNNTVTVLYLQYCDHVEYFTALRRALTPGGGACYNDPQRCGVIAVASMAELYWRDGIGRHRPVNLASPARLRGEPNQLAWC
jgi:hypothetical protein